MQTSGADFPPFSLSCFKADCRQRSGDVIATSVRPLALELTSVAGVSLNPCLLADSITGARLLQRLLAEIAAFFNDHCAIGRDGADFGPYVINGEEINALALRRGCVASPDALGTVTATYSCQRPAGSTVAPRGSGEGTAVPASKITKPNEAGAPGASQTPPLTELFDGLAKADMAAAIAVPSVVVLLLLAVIVAVVICWKRRMIVVLRMRPKEAADGGASSSVATERRSRVPEGACFLCWCPRRRGKRFSDGGAEGASEGRGRSGEYESRRNPYAEVRADGHASLYDALTTEDETTGAAGVPTADGLIASVEHIYAAPFEYLTPSEYVPAPQPLTNGGLLRKLNATASDVLLRHDGYGSRGGHVAVPLVDATAPNGSNSNACVRVISHTSEQVDEAELNSVIAKASPAEGYYHTLELCGASEGGDR